jgi:translocator protein
MAAAIAIIGAPLAGGILSSLASPTRTQWYADLEKPAWNPPSWLFGPVWTALYLAMGLASYLVYRQAEASGPERSFALGVFYLQLALNLAWSPVFFRLQRPAAALALIKVLWLATVVTVVAFYRINKAAGLLLVPYLAWVTFATALNAAIVDLNTSNQK